MPAGALRVTLPPAQKVVEPEGVMVASGGAFTVTTVGAEVAEQRFASTMVTEYAPLFVATIDGEVAPFDQAYEVMPAGADNVTCPPSQNVVGPEGVMVAAAGV